MIARARAREREREGEGDFEIVDTILESTVAWARLRKFRLPRVSAVLCSHIDGGGGGDGSGGGGGSVGAINSRGCNVRGRVSADSFAPTISRLPVDVNNQTVIRSTIFPFAFASSTCRPRSARPTDTIKRNGN